ncbi:MAG: hypothetical protein ABFD91_14675 [Anaerohalosphaeraceae bacterium]
MTENAKSKFSPYKAEIILIVLMSLIFVVPKMIFYNLYYKSGLYNDRSDILWAGMCISCQTIPFIILIIVSLVHFVRLIIKSCKAKKALWLKLALSLIPFLIPLVVFVHLRYFAQPRAELFLQGYEKWVQKEVDIPAIENWLKSLDSTTSSRMYSSNEADFSKDLPEFITRFNPPYVRFSDFEKEGRAIEFEWGGAFGHWGLRIGPADMEMPEEGIIEINQSKYETRHIIQPGVYIFTRK